MKVLLCERCFKGHRKIYMEWLTKISGIEFYCYAPENVGVQKDHFFQCEENANLKSLRAYLNWALRIKKIVKDENIDVVHVLDADSIMRFFGFGFIWSKSVEYIFTYHHFFEGGLRKLSYRLISGQRHRTSVVHTESIKKSLEMYGMQNVELCRYPAFQYERIAGKDSILCKQKWSVPETVPTIGIVGGMNGYKNILAFLEVMSGCDADFHLLICGRAGDVTEEQLKMHTKNISDKVTMEIRRLEENEYEDAIVASDIVFCIYGLEFDGASGPLTDGVCAKKMIIASEHKSLGQVVKEHCLGYVADCTNPIEIKECTENALRTVATFQYNEKANAYRESIAPEGFGKTYRKIYENAGMKDKVS